MRFLLILILCLASTAAYAAETKKDPFRVTTLPMPRFVTLRADEVYVRTGPGPKYPIKWTYKKPGLPVEIILEFENWRKIKDFEGEVGWVHQSLLSGKRAAIIKADTLTALYQSPDETARMSAQVEPKTIVAIEECAREWCEIDASGYEGWVKKDKIWGVYPSETLD